MKDNIKQILHTTAEIKDQASMLEIHAREIENAINEPSGDIIRFKTSVNHDLKEEYEICDNRLRFVFNSYAAAMYRKFGYKPVVTMICRSQEEQDRIYAVNPEYHLNPWRSPHQESRGLDFRSSDMTEEQAAFTLKYLGDNQVVYTGDRKTVIRHSVVGDHFHLQTDVDSYTSIKRYEEQI